MAPETRKHLFYPGFNFHQSRVLQAIITLRQNAVFWRKSGAGQLHRLARRQAQGHGNFHRRAVIDGPRLVCWLNCVCWRVKSRWLPSKMVSEKLTPALLPLLCSQRTGRRWRLSRPVANSILRVRSPFPSKRRLF